MIHGRDSCAHKSKLLNQKPHFHADLGLKADLPDRQHHGLFRSDVQVAELAISCSVLYRVVGLGTA
jgi:hypothetical protein